MVVVSSNVGCVSGMGATEAGLWWEAWSWWVFGWRWIVVELEMEVLDHHRRKQSIEQSNLRINQINDNQLIKEDLYLQQQEEHPVSLYSDHHHLHNHLHQHIYLKHRHPHKDLHHLKLFIHRHHLQPAHHHQLFPHLQRQVESHPPVSRVLAQLPLRPIL